MKRVLALLLVCALLSVSAAGHPFPVTKAAGEALYVEIPQDSYCRAPATTAYLPIMMGNLSDSGTMTIQSVEVLGTTGTPIVAESMEVALESMAGMVHSGEEIRTALGIAPATTTDITTAQTLIAETTSAADAEQQDTLVEEAFLASQAQQSMKNPDELTADEAQIQNLLKTETLAVDLAQFTTDVTSETAVPVTVRITGELAGQPFTIEQQTTVFLLASLPNGGMWHPGDGHVHTQGLSQPDTVYSYPLAAKENYGFSDATDGATVKIRRDQAYSNGLQWIVITDHAGENSGHWTDQARLELDEWKIYQLACSRATTLYSPTVTVCPGEELATKELGQLLGPTGHLLCYGKSSYAASYGSCQDLTSRATGDGGFGIIAHPYQGVPWSKDWSATPWNGLELISNRSAPDAQAVTKWDEQLRANLSDEVANKYRCVGMSNSDVHFTLNNSSWGGNMNYIYTGKPEVPGTDDVWKSIRNGALTASSDGSFAAATVNGVYPGYTATVAAGSTVSVVVTGTPVKPTYTTAKVTVLVNGQAVPLNVRGQTTDIIPLRNGRSFTTPYSIPISTDAYIRVEVRYCIGGTDKGYCFVNPVFISASGTSTYTLTTTASPSTGGMVAKNPDLVTYAYNTPVTLTATLTAGYTFTGWSGDLTGSTNPASITMTGNKSITATFAPVSSYTITASAGSGGSISPSGSVTVNQGSSQSFTISPSAGYHVQSVLVDGSSVGALTSYTFPNVQANHTVTATFAGNTGTVTIAAGTNGSVSPTSVSQTYGAAGTTITATPNAGYQFVSWSATSNPTYVLIANSSLASTTFTTTSLMPQGGTATIIATFAPVSSYTLTTTVFPSAGGSIFRSPNATSYASGTVVTLTAAPTTGYTFTGWSGDLTGSTNPASITMTGNKNVTATFAATPSYTLTTTVSPSTGGSVTRLPNATSYVSGTTVVLTATPTAGYTFMTWSGDLTGSTNPASITMTGNKNVTATFQASPVTYTLTTTVSPSTGGMVTKSPNQSSYPSGTVVTLTAAPAAGYALTGWSGDLTGSTNPTTIAMTGNKNVTAVFQANTPPSAPVLLSPSNGLTGVSRTPTFQWSASSGTAPITYTLQVSTNSIFNSMVVNQPGLSATSYTLTT